MFERALIASVAAASSSLLLYWPFWGFRAWHKSGHSPLPRPRRDGSQDVEKIQFKAQTDFFFNKDFGPR